MPEATPTPLKPKELERRLTHCDWLVRMNAVEQHWHSMSTAQRDRAVSDATVPVRHEALCRHLTIKLHDEAADAWLLERRLAHPDWMVRFSAVEKHWDRMSESQKTRAIADHDRRVNNAAWRQFELAVEKEAGES